MATALTTRATEGLLCSPRKKTPTSKFINSLDSPDRTPATTATTPSPSSSLLSGEFYAIRKGKGIKHCIFASWEHAKEHVHNYKDAVYNVFDKMEDALLYIRLPLKASNTKAATQKRKRTAILPCSSANTLTNCKKPRTVSITQASLPVSVKISSNNDDKENQPAHNAVRRQMPAKVLHPKLSVEAALEPDDTIPEEDGRPLPKILEQGYKKDFVKGWRANALFPQKKQCREKWEKRYLEDVAELKQFRSQSKNTSIRDVHKMNHCSGIPNAFSLAYLNWSWGVGEAYHRYLAFQQRKQKPSSNRQRMKNNKLKATPANRSNHYSCSTCVITNREAARKRFTCRAMFYSFRVAQLAEMSTSGGVLCKKDLATRPCPMQIHNQSPLVNGCSRSKELMDEARADWETLSPEDKAYWVEQERLHDERQPEILKILEEALRRDPKRSAKKLSEDVNFWCGKTTIGKWKNLRIGPSYRKGISNPVSRDDQHARMNATATSESTEYNEYDEVPYKPSPTQCLSSCKKAEMEAHMEEQNLII